MKLSALVLLALAGGAISAACAQTAHDDAQPPVDDHELREDGGRSEAGRDSSVTPDGAPRPDAQAAGFVDPRDNQAYPTIKLGAKTWLAKNLNFTIAGSSYCYGNVASNCDKDGRLYTWSVARAACPAGWHLGSDEDWQSLEVALGMASDQLGLEGYSTVRGTSEGTKAKAATGFGARPAGYRTGGSYEALGDRTYFWTADTRGGDVWRRRIGQEPTIFRFTNPPGDFAISIRCVRN